MKTKPSQEKTLDFNRDRLKDKKHFLFRGIVKQLMKWNVNPNFVTIFSAASSLSAVYFLFDNHYLFLLFSFLHFVFDNIDGNLARMSGKVTKFGNLFDKTADNLTGALMLVKAYFVLDEPLALWALAGFIIHMIIAGKAWKSFLCPAVSSIRILFLFKLWKLALVVQTIYSPLAIVLFYVLLWSKKISVSKD